MSVTGWKTFSTHGTTYSQWTNGGNCALSNNTYATATDGLQHDFTNWGFSASDIPAGCEVDYIEVSIEAKVSSGAARIDCALMLNGALGSGYKASPVFDSTKDATKLLTDSSLVLSYGLYSRPNYFETDFGLVSKIVVTSGSPTVSIDQIKIRAYYTQKTGVIIYTCGVELTYTEAFTVTHRDYFEWTENYMNTFLTRLQNEIKTDSTIAAYNSARVAVMANGDLTRYQVNAMLGSNPNLIIIHSPAENINREIGGSGREDVAMECTITTVARTAKGFDGTNDREVNLTGDGTATIPGVLEMQADIESLLHNNGAMLLLDSGGQPYLWDLEWGTVEVEADEAKRSEVLMAHRRVTGHKWQQNWS